MKEKRFCTAGPIDRSWLYRKIQEKNNIWISQDLFVHLEPASQLEQTAGILLQQPFPQDLYDQALRKQQQDPTFQICILESPRQADAFFDRLAVQENWTYMDRPEILHLDVDVQDPALQDAFAFLTAFFSQINQIFGGQGIFIQPAQKADARIQLNQKTLLLEGNPIRCDTFATLALVMLMWLKVQQLYWIRVDAKDGRLFVNRKPVMDLDAISLFGNNRTWQDLKARQTALIRQDDHYLAQLDQDAGDLDACQAHFQTARQLNALNERMAQLENSLMEVLFLILKNLTPIQSRALDLFLSGDPEKAAAQAVDPLLQARLLSLLPDKKAEAEAIYQSCWNENTAYEWFGFLRRNGLHEESLAVLDRLEGTDPAKLALNRAKALTDLDHKDQALAQLEACLSLSGPDLFPAGWLAECYSRAADLYQQLGQPVQGREAARKALLIRELLAQKVPVAYETDLADSWHKLGKLYADTGQITEAEQTFQKDLEIWQRLAEKDPEVYEPDLARSWGHLGALYILAGRYRAAREPHQKALALWQKLADADSRTYGPDLARAWNNLGIFHRDVAEFAQGETAFRKSLEEWQGPARRLSEEYEPERASTWNNLGILLRDTGRYEEAEAALRKSLEIWQRLPAGHEAGLATSWNNLGNFYRDAGRFDLAEKAYLACLERTVQLAGQNPGAYDPNLASCYNNLGMLRRDMGRNDLALQDFQKALEIRQRLAKKNPRAYQAGLASTWNNLGTLYDSMNMADEAEKAYRQGLEIRQKLARRNPESHQPDLAATWFNLANLHTAGRQYENAEAEYWNARTLWEGLAKKDEVFLPDLAACLYNLGVMHHQAGRIRETVTSFEQAKDVYEKLARTDPDRYEPALAQTGNAIRLLRQKEMETGMNQARASENRKIREYNAPIKKEIAGLYDQIAEIDRRLEQTSRFSFKKFFGPSQERQNLEAEKARLLVQMDELRGQLLNEA